MSYLLKENDTNNRPPKPDTDVDGQLDRTAIEQSLAEKDKVIARTQWLLYGFLVLLLAAVIVLLALLWPSLNIGSNNNTDGIQEANTDIKSEISDAEVNAIDSAIVNTDLNDAIDNTQSPSDESAIVTLEQSNNDLESGINGTNNSNANKQYLDTSEQDAVAAALAQAQNQKQQEPPVRNNLPARPVVPSTPAPKRPTTTKPPTTTKAPAASRPKPTNNTPSKDVAPSPPPRPSVDVSREIDTSYEAFINAAESPVLVAPEK